MVEILDDDPGVVERLAVLENERRDFAERVLLPQDIGLVVGVGRVRRQAVGKTEEGGGDLHLAAEGGSGCGTKNEHDGPRCGEAFIAEARTPDKRSGGRPERLHPIARDIRPGEAFGEGRQQGLRLLGEAPGRVQDDEPAARETEPLGAARIVDDELEPQTRAGDFLVSAAMKAATAGGSLMGYQAA